MFKAITLKFIDPSTGLFKIQSDAIGALASGLCMIHCLATPFFSLHQLALRVVVIRLLYGGNGWITFFFSYLFFQLSKRLDQQQMNGSHMDCGLAGWHYSC